MIWLIDVKNEGYYKVLYILGLKIKFLSQKLIVRNISNKLTYIESKIASIKCEQDVFLNQIKNFQLAYDKQATKKTFFDQKSSNYSLTDLSYFIAGVSSVKFINEHMIKVKVFDDKYKLLKYAVNNIQSDGLILEFGVYRGTTVNQIAELLPNNKIYGFDSFEGLPETWRSGYEKGEFRSNHLPDVRSNVELVKGWFDDSIPRFCAKHNNQKIAFIHVDCDLYSSTKCIFNNLIEMFATETILLFDEFFNYPGWEKGEYKAFQEFLTDNKLICEYLGYVKNYEQCAVKVIRRREDADKISAPFSSANQI